MEHLGRASESLGLQSLYAFGVWGPTDSERFPCCRGFGSWGGGGGLGFFFFLGGGGLQPNLWVFIGGGGVLSTRVSF